MRCGRLPSRSDVNIYHRSCSDLELFLGPMFEVPMDSWPNSTKLSCVYKEHIVGLHILRATGRAGRRRFWWVPLVTVCHGQLAVCRWFAHQKWRVFHGYVGLPEVTFGDPRGSPDAQSHLSWLLSHMVFAFFGAYRWKMVKIPRFRRTFDVLLGP